MISTKLWASLLASASASAVLLGVGQSAVAAEADNGALATSVEEVVVTGTRNQATDIKREAPVILDIRPLEQIRSLPDVSAAEVLQRLPGISMESDTGEGRFVNIRGMDADLNGTTFDGVRMMANNPATPQGGARAVGMDAFPAGLLGGVEVIKSLTPDVDAEGLGGVVNLQPRIIPPGADHIFDASLGGGVETLRPTARYRAEITGGRRFLDGKLSLILNYSLDQDHRAIDDVEEDYAYVNDGIDVPAGTSSQLGMKQFDNLQNRWYQYSRRRQAYGGGISYDPTDDTGVYLRGFHDGYSEIAHKHEFVLGNLGHNILSVSANGNYDASQTSLRYANINTHENLGNDLIEFGGHTVLGALKVDGRGSWTQGYDTWPYSIYSRFSAPSPVDVVYNNSNPDHPTYQLVGGGSLVHPALYTQASGSNSPSQSTDTEYAGAVNFYLPLEFADNQGVFKFGGEVRERTRRSQQYTGGDLNFPSQNLSDYVSGQDVLYYNGWYNLGPQPLYDKLLSLPEAAVTPDPTTFVHDSENVFAGYAQYSATYGALDVIGGVRVESTHGSYRAQTITTDASGNTTITPNEARRAYTNLFPDLAFKYRLSEQLQLRLAFSTAIARPGFNQITAARSVDLQNAIPIVTQGNPELKPTIGRNIDFYASYFLPQDGIVSAGVFYKAFENYVSNREVTSTDTAGFVGQPIKLQTYQNIGSAHVYGLELQYDQHLSFLPGLMSGLGFEGNLTWVSSRGQIRAGEFMTLPQTSPVSANAAVLFDKGPLHLKLAAAYVSTNLWVVGGDPTTDVYSQPRARLDFGGSYDVSDSVQIYVDAKNLTNTHLRFTYTKSSAYPIQNEFYDADYLFGVRVKF